MKKLILTFALMTVTIMAGAQTAGQWHTTMTEGDDLLGIDDTVTYTYEIDGVGRLIISDWASCHFCFVADHPLDIDRTTGSERNSGIDLLVGIYNSRCHLREKIHVWMSPAVRHSDRVVEPHTAWLGVPIRQTKKVRHIFDVLRADDGRYLRIVLAREALPDIDAIITQYHSNGK